jgi:hypothetical protein
MARGNMFGIRVRSFDWHSMQYHNQITLLVLESRDILYTRLAKNHLIRDSIPSL